MAGLSSSGVRDAVTSRAYGHPAQPEHWRSRLVTFFPKGPSDNAAKWPSAFPGSSACW